jgi:hypothetical protein
VLLRAGAKRDQSLSEPPFGLQPVPCRFNARLGKGLALVVIPRVNGEGHVVRLFAAFSNAIVHDHPMNGGQQFQTVRRLIPLD